MINEEQKEKLVEILEKCKQYPFEPSEFRRIFYKVFGDEFIWLDLFFDKEDYKSFTLWHKDDTWYIYTEQFDVGICWYKGLGRINQCTNEFLDENGLETFFILLKQEYEN